MKLHVVWNKELLLILVLSCWVTEVGSSQFGIGALLHLVLHNVCPEGEGLSKVLDRSSFHLCLGKCQWPEPETFRMQNKLSWGHFPNACLPSTSPTPGHEFLLCHVLLVSKGYTVFSPPMLLTGKARKNFEWWGRDLRPIESYTWLPVFWASHLFEQLNSSTF